MISLSLKNRADAAKVLNLNENLAVRKSFLEKAFIEACLKDLSNGFLEHFPETLRGS